MSTDDIFGAFPGRPDHNDFWKLSDIILKLDGRMQEATEDEKEKVWRENIARWVDEDSVNYMAMQRAMRALGFETAGELQANLHLMVLAMTLYTEGFQVGAEFATKED